MLTWLTILYFSSVVITFVITGFLAWYAWRKPPLPGVRVYAGLAFSEALLALAELLSLLSPSAPVALFWFKIRFLFTALIPVLWLAFALAYNGQAAWFLKKLWAGFLVIPLLTQIMLWTNRWHGLWQVQDVTFHQKGFLWIADVNSRIPGLWYLVHTFYSLILLTAGIVVILITAWHKPRQLRGQAWLLTTGALLVLVISILPLFKLLPQSDFNPFTPSIGLASLLYGLAILEFKFLQRTPTQIRARLTDLEPQEKRSLAIFVFIFILLTSSMAAIGYLVFQNYQKQFRLQIDNQLSSIAELKVQTLVDWRSERLGDANTFFQNPIFTTHVQDILADPSDNHTEAELQAWFEKYLTYNQYDRISLVDLQGVEQVAVPTPPAPISVFLNDQIQAVLDAGQNTLLDFYRDQDDGMIHLALLVPIYDQQTNMPLAVLVLRIDPAKYLYPFIQQWPVPSQTSETLLVRRDGNDVLYLNDLKFQVNTALNFHIPLTQTITPAVKAVLGQTGIVEGTDYRGVPVVAFITPISNSPWFMIARMDSSEVYAPINSRLWQIILIFVSLSMFGGMGLGFIWRQQRINNLRTRASLAEALRASEAELRSLFAAMQDAVIVYDINGRYLKIAPTAPNYLYRRSTEMLGKTVLAILPPEQAGYILAKIQQTLASDQVVKGEYSLSIAGKEIFFEFSTSSLSDTTVVWVAHDITDRKRAENMLRMRLELLEYGNTHSLEEVFRKTLDDTGELTNSPIGFYHFVDEDQQSLSTQTWSTRTLQEYCSAQGRGQHSPVSEAGIWAEPVYTHQPVIHNDYATTPNRKGLPAGHAALIRELVAPILRAGKVVAILGVGNKPGNYTQEDIDIVTYFADIAWESAERKRTDEMQRSYTERLQSEVEQRTAELRTAQEQLVRHERLAVLGQLAGSVSHELRNPLGVIPNSVYLLKMIQPEAPEKVKEYLGIIEREAQASERIISDLLDFTRIKAPEYIPIAPSALIRGTLDRYPPPPTVQVSLDIPSDLPQVYVDPHQLTQVLGNLVTNACQAMPQGGQLTITASTQGETVSIAVQDTGEGISPKNMTKLFEPLFTTKIKGIGLGLAICKNLIEANHGRIEVESVLGQGSTFTVFLPVYVRL